MYFRGAKRIAKKQLRNVTYNTTFNFMKLVRLLFLILFMSNHVFAKDVADENASRKGKVFIYWGYNREWFTKSDIKFTGNDYNFTLADVVAKDRQSPFGFDPYLNPTQISIPQFNFRVGYYFKNNYSISFGIDHMKYVVAQGQTVKITGTINHEGSAYNGEYNNANVVIQPGFLLFEHTNGLNYLNLEVRRIEQAFSYHRFKMNVTAGIGTGILLPRTDATLLNIKRHDEFHLAGYGIGGVVGVNIPLYKALFIQTEFKEGFINMPDIRTTYEDTDRAHQHFFFSQFNVVLGAMFGL